MSDNPLCTDNYRQLVLDLLPGIVKLDNIGKYWAVLFEYQGLLEVISVKFNN